MTLLLFVGVAGLLVMVHEFGHYLMARWLGVRVATVSFGFGPKLAAWRSGETDYVLSAIPFGGFVKMAGATTPDGEAHPDDFTARPRWQRCLILAAGPLANMLLALLLIAGLVLAAMSNTPQASSGVLSGTVAVVTIALEVTAALAADMLTVIAAMLSGAAPPNQLMGPLGMAHVAGEAARTGLLTLIGAVAFLSLNLGICNLLPVPLLDGGHIVMLTVEGAMARDFTPAVRRGLLRAGLAIVLLLVATTIYNDIVRLDWIG